MKITVFDFETANGSRLSACELGIAVFERHGTWKLQECRSWRFPPVEGDFAPANTRTHGITSADVEGLQSFAEIWPQVSPYFESDFLAAHGATFDVDVLCRQLDHAGFARPPGAVICTHKMAQRHFPTLPKHGLKELCTALRIPFVHHVALHDSLACGRVLQAICSRTGMVDFHDEDSFSVANWQSNQGGFWEEDEVDFEFDDSELDSRPFDAEDFDALLRSSRRLHEAAQRCRLPTLLDGWSIAITGDLVEGEANRRRTAATLRQIGARCDDNGLFFSSNRNPIGPTNVLVISEVHIAEISSGAKPSGKVFNAVKMQRKGKQCALIGERAFYDRLLQVLQSGEACAPMTQECEGEDMRQVQEAVLQFESAI